MAKAVFTKTFKIKPGSKLDIEINKIGKEGVALLGPRRPAGTIFPAYPYRPWIIRAA